jgi:hypothetical protein
MVGALIPTIQFFNHYGEHSQYQVVIPCSTGPPVKPFNSSTKAIRRNTVFWKLYSAIYSIMLELKAGVY